MPEVTHSFSSLCARSSAGGAICSHLAAGGSCLQTNDACHRYNSRDAFEVAKRFVSSDSRVRLRKCAKTRNDGAAATEMDGRIKLQKHKGGRICERICLAPGCTILTAATDKLPRQPPGTDATHTFCAFATVNAKITV